MMCVLVLRVIEQGEGGSGLESPVFTHWLMPGAPPMTVSLPSPLTKGCSYAGAVDRMAYFFRMPRFEMSG